MCVCVVSAIYFLVFEFFFEFFGVFQIDLDVHRPQDSKGLSKKEHEVHTHTHTYTHATHTDSTHDTHKHTTHDTYTQTRLARDGPNILTPPKQTPEWLKLLHNFVDPFMILLEISGNFLRFF